MQPVSYTYVWSRSLKFDFFCLLTFHSYLFQIFELLSHQQPKLPGFDVSSWQSTIRTFASAHPDYADLQAWDGSESSDLFYSDVSGALTALMIAKGYLEEREWRGERPEYYIEVKTTMSNSVETPFYLSKWQYTRVSLAGYAPVRVPNLLNPFSRCNPCLVLPTRRTGRRRGSTRCSGCMGLNRDGLA